MSRFYSLIISEVRRETADAVSIAFEVPPDAKEAFRFEPGQYLTLRATIDGESVRRPYSICSGIDEPHLRVGIKAVSGGRFSTFAQDLQPGDTLDVMPPLGHFRWLSPQEHSLEDGPCNHLAFAAGSGITPILSILKSVLTHRPQDTFTLCYGNRGQGSVMFLEELHDLKDAAMTRLQILHVFSREKADVDLQQGHLDGDHVRAFVEHGLFDPKSIEAVYICGPGEMNGSISEALEGVGVEKERIRFERFTAAPRTAAPPPVAATPTSDGSTDTGVTVHAIIDGLERTVTMRSDETVIAAAERQGVDLPYSCAGGMCCTCRCKLVEGDVRMDVCYSLEPWELESGFVLACQAHPTTDRVVMAFDAH